MSLLIHHDEVARSLGHSLAVDVSIDSWLVTPLSRPSHPKATLEPPFQPRPHSPPLHHPGVRLHSRICKVHFEHRKHTTDHHHHHHHILPQLRRHDRSNSRPAPIVISSFVLDQSLYSPHEEDDILEDIHSLRSPSVQPPSLYPNCFSTLPVRLSYPSPSPTFDTPPIATSPHRTPPTGRSLTDRHPVPSDEMTRPPAPDSPPDLSGSKSSKSSSYHSSLSSPDGIVSDVSNFEDVVLEDDSHNATVNDSPRKPIKRPAPSTLQTLQTGALRNRTNVVSSPRDVTLRRNYPSLRGHVEQAISKGAEERSRNPSKGGYPSSAATDGAGPFQDRPRSRSASPIDPPHSARSVSSFLTQRLPSKSKLGPVNRRGSWQPQRKTVKQLEAEYHDSDDELPDDTALWNVPVSPRPAHERPLSRDNSHGGTPERSSSVPPPIPLAHSMSAPLEASLSEFDGREIPTHTLPPRTSSLHSPPPGPHYQASFRDSRAKSWTLAMSDLSEEARIITEALEYHADDEGRKYEDMIQRGSRSARPSLETSKPIAKSMVELPPLQKGNIMIDPLPISKEKEKVLARTRPSWLPPKDPKEEKKHLKEYQKMMAASLEAERKREAKAKSAQIEKDDVRVELDRIWDQYVYPEWDQVVSEHRTRELWWQGVSPKMRGQVWQRAIGNELALTDATYNKALKRAQDVRVSSNRDEITKCSKRWLIEIENDAATAYSGVKLFQAGSTMYHALVDLLSAYAMYRSDVGYLHGLHLVGATVLLQVSTPSSAFILLANCLNRPLPLAFLTSDAAATSRHYAYADQTLSFKFNRLRHFLFDAPENDGLGLQPEDVFEPLFRSLLANGLEMERLVRVWDCWVFEGDRTFIRAAVAILGLLEGQICLTEGLDLDEKRQKVKSLLGWGPWGRSAGVWDFRKLDGGDEDGFMRHVRDAGRVKS